jgi:pimeloyl-ACP methyl ester carboxylesterase
MRQKITDKKLQKFFRDHQLNGSVHYYNKLGRRIRFIRIDNQAQATLFFIPGSPASIDLFIDYYKDPDLLQHFDMIAVDRPGYGNSGYGKPEPSIERQAEMIVDCVANAVKPVIICAGSHGASVACRLVMDHPDIAAGLVLDGPSLGPGLEKMFWLTPVIEHTFLRWLLPPHHRTANTEKIHHKEELTKMLPLWEKIHIPVMYIQGEKDRMIYKSNAEFAKKHLTNVPLLDIEFVPRRQHFITRKEMPLIKQKILQMYQLVQESEVPYNDNNILTGKRY